MSAPAAGAALSASRADELAAAYASCEALTRAQAANFYYGIRLLPRERRRAMCAVYAFARRVDDIGDGSLPAGVKGERLDMQSQALRAIAGTGPAAAGHDAVMVALADAQARFSLPLDALEELVEGVRMDVHGTTYESIDELVLYCRRVAGTIGRVSLAIFGMRADAGVDPRAAATSAEDLGVALQLTNILRDIREDARNGRVYLPGEDLRRFGLIAPGEPLAAAPARLATLAGGGDRGEGAERLAQLMRFEAARARGWFERGMRLTPLLDRRSAACVRAMAGIYRRLLERIDARPHEAMGSRVSLPVGEKAWVAARGLIGGAAP